MVGEGGRIRTLVLGAAGRDFHDFNMLYRDNPEFEVIAFTAAQIPNIAGRTYPPSLAGSLYPSGIPIQAESDLEALIREHRVDRVHFGYSDVSHQHVMQIGSRALAAGAAFVLASPWQTWLRPDSPVIAVTAVRTGCGKSQVARFLSRRLRKKGYRVAVLRHPMPYGRLELQRVQRFASPEDLMAADCTIEEREEYEPHIAIGNVVFAGVDYAAILQAAETEADIILWDGGNNDLPFVRPDCSVVLVDALRPEQIATHHPGETSLRLADIVVIAKTNATAAHVADVMKEGIKAINPVAPIVLGCSMIAAEDESALAGRRVLVVEDGPTITHGGMPHGAGYAASLAAGAAEIVDPRGAATGSILEAFRTYPHIGPVLPALGYGNSQLAELERTIQAVDADVIAVATPIDLAALIELGKPSVHIRYEYEEGEEPGLGGLIDEFLDRRG